MYDEIYVGASLSILIKLYFKKNKILVIEKENYFGGAWRNSYKHIFKNIDLACHLIVTQSKKHSNEIINFYKKKCDIHLKEIEKENFYYDTEDFKAYGKNGPALICKTGWSDMLNKIKKLVIKKKNITFIKNVRATKIFIDQKSTVSLSNKKKISGTRIFLPTYCDLKNFHYFNKKIDLPSSLVKNIHYIFYLNANSDIFNLNFQGFWSKNSQDIFDRLSISSHKNINKEKSSYVVCARVSKNFKSNLSIINSKSILSFLMFNNLIIDGEILRFKRVTYNCSYRTIDQINDINKLIKKNNIPLSLLNTKYMGHWLYEISQQFKNDNI